MVQATSQAKAVAEWTKIVGPEVAAHTNITAIRNGVLIVETDSPAWAQQLTLLKPRILDGLKKATEGAMKDIRFNGRGATDTREQKGKY